MVYPKLKYKRVLISVLVVATILLSGCNKLKTTSPELKRFEKDLFISGQIDSQKINDLTENYPDFFSVFCSEIISIGPYNSPQTSILLEQFVSDPVISRVYYMVDSIFEDINSITKSISAGLENFNKLNNRNDTIQLITFISGFNQSFVSLPGVLGISLDNFMGAETEYYKQLAIPTYLRQMMSPEHLSVNAVRAWIMSEFSETNSISTLLDNMIYQGKILYLLSESLPRAKKHEIMNYSPEQMEWCNEYESTMWEYLVEHELLYSADRILISRMTKDAPFVREFSQDSPGKAGSWLGFKIVEAFMKKTKIHPSELVSIKDSRRILADSRYRPG